MSYYQPGILATLFLRKHVICFSPWRRLKPCRKRSTAC